MGKLLCASVAVENHLFLLRSVPCEFEHDVSSLGEMNGRIVREA